MAKTNVKIDNKTVDEAEHYVRMVGLGHMFGVTLVGPAGMGKTHLVENVLNDIKVNYVKYGGHITLATLYEFLYENHDKVIFFDDCSNIVAHTEMLEILKQALSETAATRIIHYRSLGTRINAPKEFEFTGRIIMTFNKFTMDANVQAVMSRAPLIELKFARDEILDAMYKIANGESSQLAGYEQVIVTKEIETNTDFTQEISLRDQQQAFKIYTYAKMHYGNPPPPQYWKPLLHRMFKKKQESWIKEIVKDAVGDGKLPRKELVRVISIKRNMSPRNAQRKVAEWLEAGEIYQNKLRDGDVSIKPFR